MVAPNHKARLVIAAVIGLVSMAALIWLSYGLARGASIFGANAADWGTVAAWAGGIATFLAALVALLVAAGVFESRRAPRLRITFEHTEPWCRTGERGELSFTGWCTNFRAEAPGAGADVRRYTDGGAALAAGRPVSL